MLPIILLCFAVLSFGQEEGQGRRQQQAATPQPTPSPQALASPVGSASAPQRGSQERPVPTEEPPIITHHEIRAGGRTLRYTATAGMMPLKNREGETEA